MSLQPTIPDPVAPSPIEQAYINEEPPGLWPSNQDSNFGLHRKVFCDILWEAAQQLDLMINEKFLDTTLQFVTAHEAELGLTLNQANVTLAQRRAALQARRKRGPFTKSLRRQVVESFVQGALSGGTPATFGTQGIPFGVSGIPLYSGLTGDPTQYYNITENVPGFSYTVTIDSRVTPDLPGLTRELNRITPAGISFTIIGVGTTLVPKSGGGKSGLKLGTAKRETFAKTGGAKAATHPGGAKQVGTGGTAQGFVQLPTMFGGTI